MPFHNQARISVCSQTFDGRPFSQYILLDNPFSANGSAEEIATGDLAAAGAVGRECVMAGLPLVGDEFAGYRVRGVLGRGGMSVVYQAENLRLSSVIALKVLAPELAADDVFRARFLEESRIAASAQPGWQDGHQKVTRSSCPAERIGVPHRRHGLPRRP